jgi:L-asparaginase
MPMLPSIVVLSLGGTIAMTPAGGAGAVPTLSGAALVAAVPGLAAVAAVTAVSFRQVPSADLTVDDLVALAGEVTRRLDAGAAGVVITQGTDTLEETAFALDVLVEREAPVVVTGALRNAALPSADGPANILAAVQVAASPVARGLGTLAVLNDEIHAARYVRKMHTTNPAAFRSPSSGPIGWMVEGRPRIAMRPVPHDHVPLPPPGADQMVALLPMALGEDGRLLPAIAAARYAGLVIEALGGGHVPARVVAGLARLVAAMPVVLASRTGSGEILRETYGYPGSETDLLAHGLIRAGSLDGPKARLLLTLLLRSGATRDEVTRAFARWAGD